MQTRINFSRCVIEDESEDDELVLDLKDRHDLTLDDIDQLEEFLKVRRDIEGLYLQGSLSDEKVMIAVAQLLEENKTLKHVKLGFNGITATGVFYIVNALAVNTTIKNLELNYAAINVPKSKGIFNILAVGLRKNSSILSLNLAGNNLNDEDVGELVDFIITRPTLNFFAGMDTNETKQFPFSTRRLSTTSDLFGDHETSFDAKKMNAATFFKAKLTDAGERNPLNINLSSNAITDKGALILCNALLHNRFVKLNLDLNKTTEAFHKMIGDPNKTDAIHQLNQRWLVENYAERGIRLKL